MIQMGTILNVADNSGAKELGVVKVLGKKNSASVGDIVVVSAKKVMPNGAIKKKTVAKAVIVRVASPIVRSNGVMIKCSDNAGVIIDDKNEPVGSRILGPILQEVRAKGFKKIVSLAKEVL